MNLSDEQWAELLRVAGSRATAIEAWAKGEGLIEAYQPELNVQVEGADAESGKVIVEEEAE